MPTLLYDVIIVGAGPAGLSAALILGRCRRRVLICDEGNPRNAASHALHGFLSRDGIPPSELRTIGREQLAPYESVEFRNIRVKDALKVKYGFEILLDDGSCHHSRRLLLATGMVDDLPEIDRVKEFYGSSLFHCPYCDGWEVRDQPMAVYGCGMPAHGLALELTIWSSDVIVCSDGPSKLTSEQLGQLSRNGISVREDRILRFDGTGGILEQIVFRNGEVLPRKAIFFCNKQRQRSHLPEKFGCLFSPKGDVQTGNHETTNVPGLYVAGDASRNVQFVAVATAEGAEAAYDINSDLLKEDLQR